MDLLRPTLFLDLDGVFADFEGHFPECFGVRHDEVDDDRLWELVHGHGSYFRDLPVMPGAKAFYDAVKHHRHAFLTACPREGYLKVAQQKHDWVREHLDPRAFVLPVMGGHNKVAFLQCRGDVLIDDMEKNCRPWEKAGGLAILHRDFPTSAALLESMTGLEVRHAG